ncbi:dUTP diphosphatase [Collimonas antrihumi]|uniref:dUTP diphosphatase n=1 Tax=Collimonas antrihumi TaxID=1940615 RepID=UPI001B8B90F8|nr:dUTP diphosphatase [Collimonas antrihumi]
MKKISYEQASAVMKLLAVRNGTANANWVISDYPHMRGVLVEAVEALDYYGWKWWSKQPRDFTQVQLKLVDILHFTLSHILNECDGNLDAAAITLVKRSDPELSSCRFDGREYVISKCDIPQLLELIAAFAASRRNNVPLLEVTFHASGLNWDKAVNLYTSKHVLCIFRQNNGYKEGRYTKIWRGKEDNIHLLELVCSLDSAASDFQLQLYQRLEERYASLSPTLAG